MATDFETEVGSIEALRQPLRDSGIPPQNQLLSWPNKTDPLPCMIGVYSMAGIVKTAILQNIYNNYKEVSGNIDSVIWFRIFQKHKIKDLQDSIVDTLNSDFKEIFNIDMRQQKLSASLEKKKVQ